MRKVRWELILVESKKEKARVSPPPLLKNTLSVFLRASPKDCQRWWWVWRRWSCVYDKLNDILQFPNHYFAPRFFMRSEGGRARFYQHWTIATVHNITTIQQLLYFFSSKVENRLCKNVAAVFFTYPFFTALQARIDVKYYGWTLSRRNLNSVVLL